jgi:putative transposase
MSWYRRAKGGCGAFFFTVTVADRSNGLLVRHIDRLRRIYGAVQKRYPFETVAICVLPDHLHAIWTLPPGDDGYAMRWNVIKAGFSRGLSETAPRSSSKQARRERGLWQRRYWEHAIRDEIDLERHVDYIHFNPVKHGHVSQVRDWPYSSFHRYVGQGMLPADWGGDVGDLKGEFGE